MDTVTFFIKIILTSFLMFGYYYLFLKDKTFHHYNRFYLLAIIPISFLLPLLKINDFTIETSNNIYLLINKLQHINQSNTSPDDFFYFKLGIAIFGLVSVFFVSKFIFGLLKIQKLKSQFPKDNFEGIYFYQTNLEDAPFSFFKNLFWKNSIHLQSDLGCQILKHEMVHIEQKHSWDKVFLELFTALFWFNPVFYFIKKEINLIHEYLADKKSVKQSDTKAFAQMLLASQFSGNILPGTSPFLNSNLKKRLKMLQQSKTKYSYLRRIFALPLLFVITFMYLVTAKNREISKENIAIDKQVFKVEKSSIKTDTIGDDIFKSLEPNQRKNLEKLDPKSLKKMKKELENLHDAILISRKNGDSISVASQLEARRAMIDEIQAQNDARTAILDEIAAKRDAAQAIMDSKIAEADSKISRKDSRASKKTAKQAEKIRRLAEAQANSPEFKRMITYSEKIGKDAEKQAKQAEKIGRLAEAQANSPEFKRMIAYSEKIGKEAEKQANSPEFKMMMDQAEKTGKEAEAKMNSTEFKKQMQDLKSNQKSIKIQAEKIKAELLAKPIIGMENRAQNNQNGIIFTSNMSDFKNLKDLKIYINGALSNEKTLNKMNPEEIKRIDIKKGSAGNEILIITK